MPSSYVDNVAPIMKLLIDQAPARVMDIGCGWGLYGLACLEYLPKLEQLDAVEVPAGRLATQDRIYQMVYEGDVRQFPATFWVGQESTGPTGPYDLVLFIDVIEHMSFNEGYALIDKILRAGTKVLVSTPKLWFEQHDEANPYETHVSHWKWSDLHSPYVVEADISTIDSIIYLLSDIRVTTDA